MNSGSRLWLRERRLPAPRLWRSALVALVGIGASIGVRPAAASNCEPHPLSSCVPSNQQWLVAGPSHFAAIPGADVLKGGALSLGLAGVYQYQPLTLVAPSPDPEGRSLPLVEHVVDAQALFAAGLGYDFEFTSVMRLVVHQAGTGIGAARSRSGSSLAETAIRDPSFGIAYSLARSGTGQYALKLRTDLSLPLGDSESFASEPGTVVAPAATFQFRAGRISLVGDLGLRLRPAVTLADVRYGSQFSASTGLCVEAISQRLFVAAEATAAPGLASAPTSPNGTRAHWVPAEWALTLSLHWSEVYSALLSGGAGLPLSSRSVDTPNGGTHSEYFAGLGAPQARVVLMLRVTSPDTGASED